MNIYIIGAGNVGLGFALALQQCQNPPVGVAIRNAKHKAAVAAQLGFSPDVAALGSSAKQADLILICVSDKAIPEVGAWLRQEMQRGALATNVVIAHTSGCLLSAALGEIDGAHLASIHPLCAMPTPERAAVALQNTFFAVEGTPASLHTSLALVNVLGGRSSVISAEAKPRYHAAAVLASNLVVALLQIATDEIEAIGIRDAQHALIHLAQGAIAQVHALGFAAGLTGPVVRGDLPTIEAHLQALPDETRAIYAALSQRAVKLAEQRGLEHELIERMKLLLTQ